MPATDLLRPEPLEDLDALLATLPNEPRPRVLGLLAAAPRLRDEETADGLLRALLEPLRSHRPAFRVPHSNNPWVWSRGFVTPGILGIARWADLRDTMELIQKLHCLDVLGDVIGGLIDAGLPDRARTLSTYVLGGADQGRPVPGLLLAAFCFGGDEAKAQLKKLAGGADAYFDECAAVLLTGAGGRAPGLGPKHVAVTALCRRASKPNFQMFIHSLVGELHARCGDDPAGMAKLVAKMAPLCETARDGHPSAIWLDLAGLYERAGDEAACQDTLASVKAHLSRTHAHPFSAALRRCADLTLVPAFIRQLAQRHSGKDELAALLRAATGGNADPTSLLLASRDEALLSGRGVPPGHVLDQRPLDAPLVGHLLTQVGQHLSDGAFSQLNALLAQAERLADPALTAPALAALERFTVQMSGGQMSGGQLDSVDAQQLLRALTTAFTLPDAPQAALLEQMLALP